MSSLDSSEPATLTQIRLSSDWRLLFEALGLKKDRHRSSAHDWWAKSPFNPDEWIASFHINNHGWYCHSTRQGGGVIELVQRLHTGMSCYDAGQWLIEQGIASVVSDTRQDVQGLTESRTDPLPRSSNKPIRQDLSGQLSVDHLELKRRGLPEQVLTELGVGYLDRPARRSGQLDPINQRLVFQVRGLRHQPSGQLEPVILGHVGGATTADQEERNGKWWTYDGFNAALELYGIDLAVLEQDARKQAEYSGHVLVVEGCFDVAKLRAAGTYNVVGTFGPKLHERQVDRLKWLAHELGVQRVRFFPDRDSFASGTARHATEVVKARGLGVEVFDWKRSWPSSRRGAVSIPEEIASPAQFSTEQLQWLRRRRVL